MMATVCDGQPSTTYRAYIPTRTQSNISLRTSGAPSRSKSYTPPSDSVLPAKEASNLIDRKPAFLSLPTPQASNVEHALDSSGKLVVNSPGDLEAGWQRFLDNHEKGVCVEFQRVSWEAFLKLKVVEVPGLKYDYYRKTMTLIVMKTSILHEQTIEALVGPFTLAQYKLIYQTDLCDFAILRGKENDYEDSKGSSFIADASFDVDGTSYFHIEVAFCQTSEHVLNKVGRILKNESVIAVLVVDIQASKFRSPTQPSKPDDFIEKGKWMTDAVTSQGGDPFGSIVVNGHTWMSKVEIDMCVYKKGGTSIQSTMPAHGNLSFPELDQELQRIWEAFITKLSEFSGTDVQAPILEMRWDVVRKQIQSALRLTAYKRFTKWYGGEKRRLEE